MHTIKDGKLVPERCSSYPFCDVCAPDTARELSRARVNLDIAIKDYKKKDNYIYRFVLVTMLAAIAMVLAMLMKS